MQSTALAHVPDSLIRYTSEIKQVSFITAQEEYELAIRYQEQGDVEAARSLVVSHLRYVVSLARRYVGYNLPIEDLIQEGNIGLMKAVKRFNPTLGPRLASYATIWITSEMLEYIVNNWKIVRVNTTKSRRKLFFNIRQLQEAYSTLTPDDIDAIATKLSVSVKDIREMEQYMNNSDMFVDTEYEDDDTETFANHLLITTDDPPTILDRESQQYNQYAGLTIGLNALDARSRYIIEQRWLSDTKAIFEALSIELGVSKERVRQIESKALTQLKGVLQ